VLLGPLSFKRSPLVKEGTLFGGEGLRDRSARVHELLIVYGEGVLLRKKGCDNCELLWGGKATEDGPKSRHYEQVLRTRQRNAT